LVQATCHKSHHPALVLCIAGNHDKNEDKDRLTSDDVLDLHQQLKKFNGDFRAIFKTIGEQQ
jgi:hypothetical protein